MNDIAVILTSTSLLFLAFLLALAAFTLRDFSRSKLQEICQRYNKNVRFTKILHHYDQALLAIELILTVALVAITGIVCYWLSRPVAPDTPHSPLGYWGGLVAIGAVLFAVVQLAPWIVARIAGERFLYHAWPALAILMKVTAPALQVTRWIDRMAHHVAGVESPEDEDHGAAITEEIRTVVDEGQREGVLRSEARTMIRRVMELQDVDVADIMTPRTAMDCVSGDATLEEVRKMFLEEGHSRVPVIGKTTDDVVGMLYAKDLLQLLDAGPNTNQSTPLAEIVRDPFYVPETMGIDTLLKSFKRERVHLAIVLDEYGGVAGLVTMEDILEEIVGEIVDEYDPAVGEQIRTVGPGISDVDARLHIDDVNERLELSLPSDRDFDTLGGFAFSLLGRIPKVGEEFQWNQIRFTVLEADKRRIMRLRLEIGNPQSIPANSEGLET